MIVAAFRIKDIGSLLSVLVASSEGFYNCYMSYTLMIQVVGWIETKRQMKKGWRF